jgi:hypothetical protein
MNLQDAIRYWKEPEIEITDLDEALNILNGIEDSSEDKEFVKLVVREK